MPSHHDPRTQVLQHLRALCHRIEEGALSPDALRRLDDQVQAWLQAPKQTAHPQATLDLLARLLGLSEDDRPLT